MILKRHTALLALLLSLALSALRPQPCHAQPPDFDPRHPDWIELPRTAYWFNDSLIRGEILSASFTGAGPVGDIDNSGTDDFILGVRLSVRLPNGDTVRSNELWIYKGIRNGLPALHDYQRIGPTELASNTTMLQIGDWDGDGDIDLCAAITLEGDTSSGNVGLQYALPRVVVFWNPGDGAFSLADTTRLVNPGGGDIWSTRYGRSYDADNDGVDDLLLRGGSSFADGRWAPTANMHLFHGVRRGQWGRDGVPATPVWGWWNVPTHNRMSVLDQNCDERPDLVLYYDGGRIGFPDMYIYYGNETTDRTGAPDTLDVEVFSFDSVSGNYALLQDLTSDGVPDLVLACSDWTWHVYAGLPGKRLSDVFGTGDDPADPENGFPDARPWAKVEMAGLLRPEFGSPYEGPLYDLGDADLDGWNDLWTTFSSFEDGPNIVAYRAGPGFDPIIDAHAYFGGEIIQVGVLGDIDGTKNPTRVLINGVGGHEVIQFFKGSRDLPTTAYDYPRKPPSGHKLLEVTGNRCTSSVGVASDELRVAGESLGLHVIPNPASGEVRIAWRSAVGSRQSAIRIHDLSGKVVHHRNIETGNDETIWDAEGVATGVYYISVTIGEQTETIKTVIE